MTVPDLSLFDGLAFSLDSVLNGIQQTETQLGTGKRVNAPSDDPVAYGTSVVLNSQMSAANSDVSIAGQIQGKLTTVDGQLATAANVIQNAIGDATQGADASFGTSQMQALAQQVGSALSTIIQVANFQYTGAYVFGGNKSLAAPYSSSGVYSGDSSSNLFTFSNGASAHLTFDGKSIFGDSSSGIVGTLTSLQTALSAGDKAGTAAALSGLQSGLQQIALVRAGIGTDLQTVAGVISDQNSNVTTIQSTLNSVVNLDVAQATAKEQSQLLQQQALISFASGLAKLPLVNILA